jgi:hypothetical protein
MKVLSFLLVSLFTSISLAGANLGVTTQVYEGSAKVNPMIGLSIDQKLIGKFFLTSFAGFGSRPVESNEIKHWGSARVGLDYRVNRLSFGAGYGVNNTADDLSVMGKLFEHNSEQMAYMKIGLKLW